MEVGPLSASMDFASNSIRINRPLKYFPVTKVCRTFCCQDKYIVPSDNTEFFVVECLLHVYSMPRNDRPGCSTFSMFMLISLHLTL